MVDKIGIIVSGGYGTGWSTWGEPELALDQKLANLIETEPYEKWEQYCKETYPEEYLGGLEDCSVTWVEKGTRFRIEEYDGSESLILEHTQSWQIAE